jgi:hypothetical protein
MIKNRLTSLNWAKEADGVYGCRFLTTPSQKLLSECCAPLGLSFSARESQTLHVTTLFSKQLPNQILKNTSRLSVRVKSPNYWDGHDSAGYLVLELESPELLQYHERWMKCGATHSFDSYLPHMTLKTPFKSMEILESLREVTWPTLDLTQEFLFALEP